MKSLYLNELKQNLTQKLNYFYIFLGEDFCLLKKNQDLILNFAYKKGFSEKITIDIKKDQDWEKIVCFYKKQNLFFKKTTLVVNFLIDKLNTVLIKNVYNISSLLNSDVLMILKFNHLSLAIQNNKLLDKLKNYGNIISCFTPYDLNFMNWIKYEIRERKINIEDKAFFLLCKYYEGDTFFIHKVLDILLITWPNTCITIENLKKIIINFFSFYPLHWINAIFQNQIKKAIYILNFFCKQKYNPLLLIRSLQKDLLKLIYIKREKNTNVNFILEKNNISSARYKFFINAFQRINFNALYKAIKILLEIEIKIKKKYDNSVWNKLQELTLILC